MKIAKIILPLSLGLMAAPALAQQPNVPGKGNPNGMSDQDYLIQREKILMRMKGASPPQGRQTPEQAGSAGKPARDSAYGQGYGSRDAAGSKPGIGGRPERPERPERPHIERPGRP